MNRLLLALFVLVVPRLASAAALCVVPTGGGDGSTWSSCLGWADLTLERGNTYYLAEGAFAGKTLDTAATGAAIVIRKATDADHGGLSGWASSLGDGVTTFSGSLIVATSDWVIDGARRNESSWSDPGGYGFRIAGSVGMNWFWFGTTADNVTIQYCDIGPDYGRQYVSSYGELIEIKGYGHGSSWTVRRSFIHNGTGMVHIAGSARTLIEYNHFREGWSKAAIRGHAGNASSTVIRFNVFEDACQGTPDDPTATACTSIAGFYGDAGSNDDYRGNAIYGNLFWDSKGYDAYTNGVITMGDDRTSQGGGPGNCDGCKVFNNTFAGMRGFNTSINFGGTTTDTEARNNVWTDVQGSMGCQAAACSNNVQNPDPTAFVDPRGGDFHLTGDGALGAGFPLLAPYVVDMEGVLRGDGEWDIGAYEQTHGGSPSFVHHPADLDQNRKLTLDEVTAFAASWKAGTRAEATMDNAVRGGFLSRSSADGTYTFDASQVCPLCWIAP
jgi:hypothetical protein